VGTPAVPALPCYGAQLGQAAVSAIRKLQTKPFGMALVVCTSLLVLEQPAVPSLGSQLVANHCALSCKLTGPAVLGAAQLLTVALMSTCDSRYVSTVGSPAHL
jgi:hypothetical protein